MIIKSLFSLSLVRCTLALVLCYTANLQAQSYIADVRKLSVEDGLSNRSVNTIYKDSRGFMWIGTRHGLNRYDGYEFKQYTKENSGLTTNDIWTIHEDTQQRLWFFQLTDTRRYIDILDPQTGHIQSFDSFFKTQLPFRHETVHDVYSGDEKTLWIATTTGKLYRYKNNRFEQVAAIPAFKQGKIEILYAGNSFLWVFYTSEVRGALETLTGVDLETGMVKTFDIYDKVLSLGMDDARTLWLFKPEEKSFLKLHWEKQAIEPVATLPPELPDFASSVTFTRRHHLNPPGDFLWWVSNSDNSRAGAPIAWNLKENIRYDFLDEIAPLFSYGSAPRISDACLDTENRLWLATDDGVFILSLKKNKFTTVTAAGKNYSSRGIVQDHNGEVYVSTYGGWLRIYPEKGVLKANGLVTGAAITKDHEGRFWFSTIGPLGGLIMKYDPLSGKRWEYHYESASGQLLPRRWTLMSDTPRQIWIGTNRGLYTLDPQSGRFRAFTRYNSCTELKDSDIYHLRKSGEGIWIGASSGLYLLEPGKGITTRYSSRDAPPYHIPYNHILHFYRDGKGVFWLATKGGGLVRFDPKDGSARQLTTADGLSSNIIYAVYEDDYGKLWLPSNYGLMRLDKKTFRVNTWLKGDGIAHNEFNTSSHYKASDGRLYFGGLAGVTSFHPKDFVAEAPEPAPLRITRCQVLNGKTGKLSDKTITTANIGTLELSPSDRSLLIEFALLNFKNTRGNTYYYKIEGLDTDWTPIRTNSLRLNALPYGRYTLRIKGRGIEGEASANILSLALQVNKPFYLKSGFIFGVIVTLTLLIYGIFRWRLQRLKRSEVRLKSIVRERTSEIQRQKDEIENDKNTIEAQAGKLRELNAVQSRWFINIAHELRTPLTLILGPIRQHLKKQHKEQDTGDIELAEKNAKSLLSLVNEILDVSRLESNRLKLNQAPANLSHLIREATAHFESFARQKGVSLSSYISEDLEMNIDRERIRNILVNLISNALKFTHAVGKVTVSVQNNARKGVTITVEDTGDGIPENDLPHVFERYFQASDPNRINPGGAGIGLSLSLELARLHGGDLSVESQLGKGSIFTLSLPQSLITGIAKPATMPVAVTLPEVPANAFAVSSNGTQDKSLILLVEDNPDMRRYIRGFMEQRYHVAEAADGREALDYLQKVTPELIISDVMMPRMDGIALAKALKADDKLKNLPFITLTARTGEADKIAALRIGIDDYLTKPFNPEELEARAINLIRNYRARKAVSHTDPAKITTPSYRETRTKTLKETVLKQLHRTAFTANDLAASANMSLNSLRRFLKKHTGLSPGQFIREIRLQEARRLLETTQYPGVAEVMYAVGFKKASYFTRVFTERFGKNPSEYL